MGMLGNVLRVMKVCMGEFALGREIRKEEDAGVL